MKLRDRMVYAAIVTCDMKRRHPAHIREFYRDLLHACDDHGRFEANAVLLRAVLFASILDRVSVRDVQGYLQALHLADDIKLYTVRGKGLGKVTKWRQNRLKTKVADYPDEDGEIELPLGGPIEDPPPVKERRKEGSVSRERSPAPGAPSHTQELTTANLQDLRKRWPCHDLEACLRGAKKYVRETRGPEGVVTVEWFNKHWMPNEAQDRRRSEDVVKHMEPVNFVEWCQERYGKPPEKAWAEMSANDRGYWLRQMGAAARFSTAEVCA